MVGIHSGKVSEDKCARPACSYLEFQAYRSESREAYHGGHHHGGHRRGGHRHGGHHHGGHRHGGHHRGGRHGSQGAHGNRGDCGDHVFLLDEI